MFFSSSPCSSPGIAPRGPRIRRLWLAACTTVAAAGAAAVIAAPAAHADPGGTAAPAVQVQLQVQLPAGGVADGVAGWD